MLVSLSVLLLLLLLLGVNTVTSQVRVLRSTPLQCMVNLVSPLFPDPVSVDQVGVCVHVRLPSGYWLCTGVIEVRILFGVELEHEDIVNAENNNPLSLT